MHLVPREVRPIRMKIHYLKCYIKQHSLARHIYISRLPVSDFLTSHHRILIFILLLLLLLTAIGFSPGGSGYFICTQILKKEVTRRFKSGGLHEKHVVATWKLGNHLSIRL